jgi:hypothetical protein
VLALGPNQVGSSGGGVKTWVLRRGASLEARKHTPRIDEDSGVIPEHWPRMSSQTPGAPRVDDAAVEQRQVRERYALRFGGVLVAGVFIYRFWFGLSWSATGVLLVVVAVGGLLPSVQPTTQPRSPVGGHEQIDRASSAQATIAFPGSISVDVLRSVVWPSSSRPIRSPARARDLRVCARAAQTRVQRPGLQRLDLVDGTHRCYAGFPVGTWPREMTSDQIRADLERHEWPFAVVQYAPRT